MNNSTQQPPAPEQASASADQARPANVPSPWLILYSGPCPSAFNMALDETLLHTAAHLGKPILRFYGWMEPAATFGYFQRYSDVAATTLLRPLIRRPTGGGIVPHDADWTYSLAFPVDHCWYGLKAIESYRRVHEWIRDAFARLQVETEPAPAARKSAPGQCFVGHEQFDLLWKGRKIAGAAQRRTKEGLLIQGSVQPPPLSLRRADWELAMHAAGMEREQAQWSELDVAGSLLCAAKELAGSKYSQAAYNEKR